MCFHKLSGDKIVRAILFDFVDQTETHLETFKLLKSYLLNVKGREKREMKKNLLWISLIVLLFLSVLSGFSVNTMNVSAGEYPAIYVDPSSVIDDTLQSGDNFTISIKTDCTNDDIWGYQFTLSYNPNVLNGGINKTETWTGDGSKKKFYLTEGPVALDSVKIYVNQTLVTEHMEGYDEWPGDGETGTFVTSKIPIVEESEEVYINASLKTRKTLGNDMWTGDGSKKTFFTTDKPVVQYSETIRMNFTDTWTAPSPKPKPKRSYNTTGKPVIYDSEEITVSGTPQTRDLDYTMDYGVGNITFTYTPVKDAEIIAKYEAFRTRGLDYTIDYLTGNMTFTDPPAAGTIIEAEYYYGHYTITWNTGIISFATQVIGFPGVGAIINATYLQDHHTVDEVKGTVEFTTAPGVGADIKVIYLYGGVTNGDLITGGDLEFIPGAFNNTAGAMELTAGQFFYMSTPPPVTSGPGTLANVTFRVVGYGCSNITLGIQTGLTGWNFTGDDFYPIIDASKPPGATEPPYGSDHIQHGYFSNMILGDVDGDRTVDAYDLFDLGKAYGSESGDPNWNLYCDFNRDDKVDDLDLSDLNENFGRSVP